MDEIVFSHTTALHIFRNLPQLIDKPKTTLPPAFASAPAERGVLKRTLLRLTDQAPSSEQPAHCMLGAGNTRPQRTAAAFHQGGRAFQAQAFVRISESVYVCCPELAFLQCTRSLDAIESMLLAYELCGTYATERTAPQDIEHCRQLSTRDRIRAFIAANPFVQGADLAIRRKVMDYVADGSASYRESALALLLSLPARFGGRAVEMPVLNYRIEADDEAAKVSRKACFYADLCWPRLRIDVEYASRRHHSDPQSRISDGQREHALRHLGWNVIQVSEADIRSIDAIDTVAETIRKASCIRNPNKSAQNTLRKRQLMERLTGRAGGGSLPDRAAVNGGAKNPGTSRR